jgi:hypothetical protein
LALSLIDVAVVVGSRAAGCVPTDCARILLSADPRVAFLGDEEYRFIEAAPARQLLLPPRRE